MALKERDFVEVDYTGTLAHGVIFDTTSADLAKKHNLNLKSPYKPVTICIGEQQILKGIDKFLVGKEVGKPYQVKLSPEESFGAKDPKEIRLVPLRTFQKQKVQPVPGLQVDIDGTVATVLRVSSGRVLVDFNHPLSGKEVMYEVTVRRQITDKKEQIESFMKLVLPAKLDVNVQGDKATIKAPALPKEVTDVIGKKISELTGVAVEFVVDPAAQSVHSHEGHSHEGHSHAGHEHHQH